jgi:hypothetical protein
MNSSETLGQDRAFFTEEPQRYSDTDPVQTGAGNVE